VISNISIQLDAKGGNYKAVACVSVESDSGIIPDGASVIGTWAVNGKYLNIASDSTTAGGSAVLVSNPVKVKSGDVFSITLSDMVKEGFLYDPTDRCRSLLIVR